MGFIPDATIAAFRGTFNLGFFFRMLSSPALHLWFGPHDLALQMDGLDPGGTVYIGGGQISDVPDAIEVLMNGQADRADWTLSGVGSAAAATLLAEVPTIKGARTDFAMAPLDERWQISGSLIPLWVGTGDFLGFEQPPQADVTKPKLARLILSTMTNDSSRSVPNYMAWTDRDQQTRFPGDKFCGRVSRYYPGQIIRWPRF